MNILVLNGSPKGNYSITLQTVKYLSEVYHDHSFDILHVGKYIKKYEKDMNEAISAIESADIILFSYPVYTFMAPYQLHRFIELIKESGISLEGKIASQITTSKHFYDVTAHNYIRDNCFDLGMKYIRGLSADMEDLLKEEGQKDARDFFEYLIFSIKNDLFEQPPISNSESREIISSLPNKPSKNKNGDVVVLTDLDDSDVSLKSMIDRFCHVMPRATRVVNIREYPFSGGCLGCFGCAVDGRCVYKDGFDEYLRNTIQSAEATVYAFKIKDHSMGARFKLYDDRQFCNGHRTVTMGKPVGYLISGDYSAEENLRTVIEGRAQVGHNFLSGIATDRSCPDNEIDDLAKTLNYAIEKSYTPPQNFLGVGGKKIFRDLIWLMRGMMKADHNFYKKNGIYDFPQKSKGTVIKMYLVGALISSPKIKAKMGNSMNEGMIAPYKKVIEKIKKENIKK
ncbi:MAG: NAD(P)H-dependent oxidoreductase [Clostridia bacterium]|nr:NAD(P)H-dependent oxidoreductase [Clostridia bacterium]